MAKPGTTRIKAILPLPMYWKGKGTKKRQLLLSTNMWMNMHRISGHKIKQNYYDIVEEWCKQLPKFKTLRVEYTLYFNNRRLKDIDNFAVPIHKFLLDALVKNGIIEDDNYKYVTGYSADFGGIGEENYAVVELVGDYED
jgi:Holliday junction resolvase RusA-like endonuclease